MDYIYFSSTLIYHAQAELHKFINMRLSLKLSNTCSILKWWFHLFWLFPLETSVTPGWAQSGDPSGTRGFSCLIVKWKPVRSSTISFKWLITNCMDLTQLRSQRSKQLCEMVNTDVWAPGYEALQGCKDTYLGPLLCFTWSCLLCHEACEILLICTVKNSADYMNAERLKASVVESLHVSESSCTKSPNSQVSWLILLDSKLKVVSIMPVSIWY